MVVQLSWWVYTALIFTNMYCIPMYNIVKSLSVFTCSCGIEHMQTGQPRLSKIFVSWWYLGLISCLSAQTMREKAAYSVSHFQKVQYWENFKELFSLVFLPLRCLDYPLLNVTSCWLEQDCHQGLSVFRLALSAVSTQLHWMKRDRHWVVCSVQNSQGGKQVLMGLVFHGQEYLEKKS